MDLLFFFSISTGESERFFVENCLDEFSMESVAPACGDELVFGNFSDLNLVLFMS